MNIGYIKKQSVPINIIDRLKYFLNVIFVEIFDQGYVLKLPIEREPKNYDKIIKNMLKKIQKFKIDTLVFSDNIIKDFPVFYDKVSQILNSESKDTLNGKKLMQYMSFEIFEYILKVQNAQIEEQSVHFLIKRENNLDLQFLYKFIEKCKTVNIVTNDIERFKKIQDNLYEKENVLISVSNNKNKALKKAKYIFNINMDKKDIEKYKINRESIIINFRENIKYNKNTFSGININNIEIDVPDEYIEKFEIINECNEFNITRLYESMLFKRISQEKQRAIMLTKSDLEKRKNIASDVIRKDNVNISGLIGNNGRIDESEIKNLTKLQT